MLAEHGGFDLRFVLLARDTASSVVSRAFQTSKTVKGEKLCQRVDATLVRLKRALEAIRDRLAALDSSFWMPFTLASLTEARGRRNRARSLKMYRYPWHAARCAQRRRAVSTAGPDGSSIVHR